MIENIEQWIVSRLDTIQNLTGQNFPTVSPTGDEEPPFCLYTLVSETSEADLSGGDDIRRTSTTLNAKDFDMRLDMHVQPVIADVVYWQKE